jgi:CheY-like chemotaxis protein
MLEFPELSRRLADDDDRPSRIRADRENRSDMQTGPSNRVQPVEVRVLLVEDDPDTQEVYSTILRHAGYVVDSADNGRDGVDLARALMPHLIITDLDMPVLSGWEAIELLRASRATRDIPVCIVSAGLTDDSSARAVSLGCEAVFPKPLAPCDLLMEVRRITRS